MRLLVSAVIILLWLLVGWYYCEQADKCCIQAAATIQEPLTSVVTPPPPEAVKTIPLGPLTFDWSAPEATTRDGWDSYQTNLLNSLQGEDMLQITGLYRTSETNQTTYDNLGLARAHETRKLFPDIPDDKIELRGLLVEDTVNPGGKNFESARFRTLKVTTNIKETADKTLIYFPYNSTDKRNRADVESYLNDVAVRVKASGETVVLVGHTDNAGDSLSNQRLGMQRAEVVRDYLLRQGIAASKIKTSSMGEEQAIQPNTTAAGRAANRRTELRIIP